eukprot:500245-Rhodomonas_salina.1
MAVPGRDCTGINCCAQPGSAWQSLQPDSTCHRHGHGHGDWRHWQVTEPGPELPVKPGPLACPDYRGTGTLRAESESEEGCNDPTEPSQLIDTGT